MTKLVSHRKYNSGAAVWFRKTRAKKISMMRNEKSATKVCFLRADEGPVFRALRAGLNIAPAGFRISRIPPCRSPVKSGHDEDADTAPMIARAMVVAVMTAMANEVNKIIRADCRARMKRRRSRRRKRSRKRQRASGNDHGGRQHFAQHRIRPFRVRALRARVGRESVLNKGSGRKRLNKGAREGFPGIPSALPGSRTRLGCFYGHIQ